MALAEARPSSRPGNGDPGGKDEWMTDNLGESFFLTPAFRMVREHGWAIVILGGVFIQKDMQGQVEAQAKANQRTDFS